MAIKNESMVNRQRWADALAGLNRTNMTEKIIKTMPIYVGIVYFIGFVAFHAYASTMAASISDVLNLRYLITGLLCVFSFIAPISILSMLYDIRSDNLKVTYLALPFLFYRTLLAGYATILILLFLSQLMNTSTIVTQNDILIILFGFVIFIISMFVDSFMTSLAAKKINVKTKAWTYLIILLVQFIFIVHLNNIAIRIYVLEMITICSIFYVYLGLVADKKTTIQDLGFLPIILVFFIFIHSIFVLPKISETFGGFLYRQPSIFIKSGFINDYRKSGLQIDAIGQLINAKLKLVTDSTYVIKSENVYIKMNKDTILMAKYI